uniref:XtrA/YqaO family protein n=1 Tax=Jeotgalibaca porci TaxID=1868793 RepID=UPI00359F7AE7
MEFEIINIEELSNEKVSQLPLKNAIVVLSNGLAYMSKLPDYGKTDVSITCSDGRVKYIDEKTEKKIKL